MAIYNNKFKKDSMKTFKKSNIISALILLLIVGFWYFIYISPYFERESPDIQIPNMSYWNLKYDIPIKINDKSGVKSYKVIAIIENEERVLLDKDGNSENEIKFNLPRPKINLSNGDKIVYKIIARDNSNYNFFLGNKIEKEFELIIDTKLPKVRIIQMSNVITKGGSAAVVFYVSDDAIGDISVTNGYQSFVVFPFHKPNYYVSIIPWYITNPTFKGAIIAKDKAGNTRKFSINFIRYNRNYRTSNLTLKSNFIDGKITELIENENEFEIDKFKSPIEMFKYVNEVIRNKDSDKIDSKILNLDSSLDNITSFKPIENAKIVGLFGDHRIFSFNKMDAGEAYHLGIDLASVKNASIIASNDGLVVMSEELGIYGNTIIIEHGYGIASLYSHLDSRYKKEGDIVKKGEIIGRSGSSGLAFGDHLHFGILVQGRFSISNEWMDSKWLKINIIDVLNNAKEIIERDNAKD
ncbi:M23 family metallopeptidase [Helicobacter sp. MIT 14-3879]|uniref:M23 family metallopeptidase n=1 Tax=Helicobacter sp. MIT 14-3879 TaxID=2040649 RepID=UPI000E1E42D1|nr:M23 family metallopeptidase [Helicobacter sp. MIT 14-3879]RDU65582.1 peptidase M23 [Helicobacter sp. MIT 14-3879]